VRRRLLQTGGDMRKRALYFAEKPSKKDVPTSRVTITLPEPLVLELLRRAKAQRTSIVKLVEAAVVADLCHRVAAE